MTSEPKKDHPRYRIKQLQYGFSLGQWVVVDGLTVAFDPVKKPDRKMWTGTEEAAQHYCDQLNAEHKRAPDPLALSQLRRIQNAPKPRPALAGTVDFVRCGCGAMYRKGVQHACKV